MNICTGLGAVCVARHQPDALSRGPIFRRFSVPSRNPGNRSESTVFVECRARGSVPDSGGGGSAPRRGCRRSSECRPCRIQRGASGPEVRSGPKGAPRGQRCVQGPKGRFGARGAFRAQRDASGQRAGCAESRECYPRPGATVPAPCVPSVIPLVSGESSVPGGAPAMPGGIPGATQVSGIDESLPEEDVQQNPQREAVPDEDHRAVGAEVPEQPRNGGVSGEA